MPFRCKLIAITLFRDLSRSVGTLAVVLVFNRFSDDGVTPFLRPTHAD